MSNDDDIIAKVHGLCDIELALLLSLVARENPIISTPVVAQNDLIAELQLIIAKTFGLTCVVVQCSPQTTVDSFTTSILRSPPPQPSPNLHPARSPSPFSAHFEYDGYLTARYPASTSGLTVSGSSNRPSSPGPVPATGITGSNNLAPIASSPAAAGAAAGFQIPNIIIAKDLNRAPQAVQIQALELLRTKRIFTRTMQTAPKQFMLIPVLAAEQNGGVKLTTHLNDQFFIAHFHDPEDGFVYLGSDEDDVVYEDNESMKSTASVVKRSTSDLCLNEATFSEFDISMLSDLSMHVNTDTEVLRYQLNIAAFLRLHRAVASGISPTATKHLEKLCCCLAPLHQIDFVTPALVVLATRKVYPHRIVVATSRQDRSVQWGSDAKVIDGVLEGFAADEVIEDVIKMVAAPA
ncbi:hypothetical protein Cpir12675_006095 [Ceratocystis pirilliformis]|uniref:magnesium chelatase n=1 Tax=Ceratocystis pirilliformis TaxID=259994 RepID=A0ABR3YKW5_9PEZI